MCTSVYRHSLESMPEANMAHGTITGQHKISSKDGTHRWPVKIMVAGKEKQFGLRLKNIRIVSIDHAQHSPSCTWHN